MKKQNIKALGRVTALCLVALYTANSQASYGSSYSSYPKSSQESYGSGSSYSSYPKNSQASASSGSSYNAYPKSSQATTNSTPKPDLGTLVQKAKASLLAVKTKFVQATNDMATPIIYLVMARDEAVKQSEDTIASELNQVMDLASKFKDSADATVKDATNVMSKINSTASRLENNMQK
jgi:hypothetical protein